MTRAALALSLLLLAGCASLDVPVEREPVPLSQEFTEQITTPEELGQLAVFFCSPAANNVRGVAWNMDGGWVAQ